MSLDVSLKLRFKRPIEIIDVINTLRDSGWMYCERAINHTPLGCTEAEGEWVLCKGSSWGVIVDLIDKKQRINESFGLTLFHQDEHESLSDFHFNLGESVLMVFIGRRYFSEESTRTDWEWFAQRIVFPIVKFYDISEIIFSEN